MRCIVSNNQNHWGVTQSPFGEAKESRSDDDQDKVKHEKREQHPNISPSMPVGDIQRQEEILSNRVRAIPTSRGIVRVIEVPAKRRHKLPSPRGTRLALRGVEHGELVRPTADLEPVKLGGDHRTHHAGVRIEVVQPALRPSRDLRERNRNTAEGREDGGEEGVKQHRDLNRRRDGTNELRKGDTEQLDEDEDEELEPGSVDTRGTLTESDGVDHQDPV